MEIKRENTCDPRTGILTKCIVTEPDGTKRDISPLFAGQMLRTINGRTFYAKEVPADYFGKAEKLESAGWYRWYHFDNWVNASVKNPEHEGYSTEEALRKCLTTASTRLAVARKLSKC